MRQRRHRARASGADAVRIRLKHHVAGVDVKRDFLSAQRACAMQAIREVGMSRRQLADHRVAVSSDQQDGTVRLFREPGKTLAQFGAQLRPEGAEAADDRPAGRVAPPRRGRRTRVTDHRHGRRHRQPLDRCAGNGQRFDLAPPGWNRHEGAMGRPAHELGHQAVHGRQRAARQAIAGFERIRHLVEHHPGMAVPPEPEPDAERQVAALPAERVRHVLHQQAR